MIDEMLIYIIAGAFLIYLINIIWFIVGLSREAPQIIINKSLIPISTIIAVRNGSATINRMLENLSKQTYIGEMEFIIVDDESTDNTKEVIDKFSSQDSRFKYVSSIIGSKYLKHKKRAIDAGIKHSRYEHLLFTDIDCIIQIKWVESMVNYFTNGADYIVGHTYVDDEKTILNKFQKIDLLLLLFASKSTIYLNSPWACSGQNQGYTKKLYNGLNGFRDIASYLQGDDTLFLQLAVKNNARIMFNKESDSYVISRTELNWKNFLLQRGRWSGDANVMWKFNYFFYLAALVLWIMSVGIIYLLLANYVKVLLIILLFKIIFEGILYQLGSYQFEHKIKYIDFIIWFMLHPIYVSIMGFFSFFNFKWRRVSTK